MNALRSLADDLRSQGIPISTKVVSEDFAEAPAGSRSAWAFPREAGSSCSNGSGGSGTVR